MADRYQRYADRKLEELGKEIGRVYRRAAREIRAMLMDFWEGHKVIGQKMLKDVKDGKITERDYRNWLRNQVFIGDKWKRKLDEATRAYVNADEKAREIIGERSVGLFTWAANRQAKELTKAVSGASFEMYDKRTVNRILRDNPKMLPEWKINEKKDYIWNEKRVQNAVAQGIVKGESVYDIGNRLTKELSAQNAGKMDMFARTAVTGAQNAGRMERMREAKEMGIDVKKRWLATPDSRVRDTHLMLNNAEVDVDEDFVTEAGNRIAYPGDPNAPPEETYNCRCTLVYSYGKKKG